MTINYQFGISPREKLDIIWEDCCSLGVTGKCLQIFSRPLCLVNGKLGDVGSYLGIKLYSDLRFNFRTNVYH